MDKALGYSEKKSPPATGKQAGAAPNWQRKISNHVAWGLLIYTALHIYVTMGALKTEKGSILPYFSLIVLVGAIIPSCRWVEKKWERVSENNGAVSDQAQLFRRDVAIIWLAAIGLPFLLTGLFKAFLVVA